MVIIYMQQTVALFNKKNIQINLPENAELDTNARGYAKFVLK